MTIDEQARELVDLWIIRYMPAGVSTEAHNAMIVGCAIGLRARSKKP